MNGVHLRALSQEALTERLITFLRETGSPLAEQPERIAEARHWCTRRSRRFAEFEPYCAFLFGPVEIEPESLEKLRANPRSAEVLEDAETRLAALEQFDVGAHRGGACARLCDHARAEAQGGLAPIRIALTGSHGRARTVRERGPARSRARCSAALRGARGLLD